MFKEDNAHSIEITSIMQRKPNWVISYGMLLLAGGFFVLTAIACMIKVPVIIRPTAATIKASTPYYYIMEVQLPSNKIYKEGKTVIFSISDFKIEGSLLNQSILLKDAGKRLLQIKIAKSPILDEQYRKLLQVESIKQMQLTINHESLLHHLIF